MSDLKGKSLIVTGGASGIGESASILAARAGARVTIADMQEAAGERLAAKIRGEGGEAQFIRTDVSNEQQVKAMVAAAVSAYGRLDCAFNNAGVTAYAYTTGHPVLFADMPLSEFRRVLDINLVGVFLCMKYEIPAMLEAGGGSIVNTSSCSGLVATPGTPDYTASKHGVIGLTKVAALDYATQNIRVNAVLPGVIRTPMVDLAASGNPDVVRSIAESMPIKRLGQPHEIAEAALWLLSDAASLVTGHSMLVDGGYTMV